MILLTLDLIMSYYSFISVRFLIDGKKSDCGKGIGMIIVNFFDILLLTQLILAVAMETAIG